jgi:iron-sulfur cluster assembly protein
MITVTDKAKTKIKQNLTKRGKGIGIRIGVKTTGCSGLAYVLEYVDNLTEGDDADFLDEFNVVVNRKDQPYLNGLTMDWVRNGLNEGFEFTNPNSKGECGCGESFRV